MKITIKNKKTRTITCFPNKKSFINWVINKIECKTCSNEQEEKIKHRVMFNKVKPSINDIIYFLLKDYERVYTY